MKNNLIDLAKDNNLPLESYELISKSRPGYLPPAEFAVTIREYVKKGDKALLIKMKEEPLPIPDGNVGTVSMVDDAADILISWENISSSLKLVPQVDTFIIFSELHITISADGHVYVIKYIDENSKNVPEDIWRYSLNTGDHSGVVRAENETSARQKIKDAYQPGINNKRSIDIRIWPVCDDDYFRSAHPDVWEIY